MNSAASSSSPPPTKKPKSVQLQDPAEGCGSTPATTTTTTGMAKPRVILRHKRNRSITRLPAANENARQQQEQEQQEQQIDNNHEDNAPLATRTRSQQARDSHGSSGSDDKTKRKKNSITIRPMQLRDLATVYQLGNQIFTASEFPNMYRTWDDYAVAGNYEGSAEFCFVAEHTSTSTTWTKLPVAKSVSTSSALRSSSSSVSPTPVGHGKKPVRKSQSNVKEANNKSTTTTTTTTTTIVAFLLGESVTKANVGTRGYIQWVAVVPAFRRLGIASSLIAEFVKVGQQQNISLLLADTPADNEPAIELFQKAGLSHKADHVYLTRQLGGVVDQLNHVDEEDMSFDFSYTVTMPNTGAKQRITIRNMEIGDLYPIYKIGEEIFTTKSVNLYNFWDESLVVNSYLSDPEFCVVATATTKGGTEDTSEHHGNSGSNNNNNNNNEDHRPNVEKVVGFAFGETIEKPRSSWKYGYLVWLGCAPDYQGMGLAKQLYHVMMELFAVEKVRMVMIDTQQNNEGALRFFRKLGFGHDEEHVYLCNRP